MKTFKIEGENLHDSCKIGLLLRRLSNKVYKRYANYILPKHPRGTPFEKTTDILKALFCKQSSLFNIRYNIFKFETF